jgi:hypothetical protein
MSDRNDSHRAKIESLEAEITVLRKQLRELEATNEETATYRIFSEARKKLLGWVTAAMVVVTLFGVVSASKLVDSIKGEIEERGVESIISEIKADFEDTHRDEIVQTIIGDITPRLDATIYNEIRGELEQRLPSAAESAGQSALAQRITQSYERDRYLIVGGSSVLRSDLTRELNRIREAVGESFETEYPDAAIYRPKAGYSHYGLVLAKGLSLSEAQRMLRGAISAGIRPDAFISEESRTSLDLEAGPGTLME